MKRLISIVAFSLLAPVCFLAAQTAPESAAALESQYKTCAKHYIPAEKCTPEIYLQLTSKNSAPLDPKVVLALGVVKQYQGGLRNPDSMRVKLAYVTDPNERGLTSVCLIVSAQNGFGGMSSDYVQWVPAGYYNSRRKKDDLIVYDSEETGLFCSNGKTFHRTRLPGIDVTDKVNEALKSGD